MIKVNLKREQVLNVQDLNSNHIIGIQWDDSRAMLIYVDGGYRILNQLDGGGFQVGTPQKSIEAYCEYWKSDIKGVYVFDSNAEIFSWLLNH